MDEMSHFEKKKNQLCLKCHSVKYLIVQRHNRDKTKCWDLLFPNLDVLPVGPPSGVQEIRVHVVFLVREVRFCGDADHPGAAVTPHAQVQRVETGPVKVLLPIKRCLGDTQRICQSAGV